MVPRHGNTTYVKLVSGEWKLYGTRGPMDLVSNFDSDAATHCVIVLERGQLLSHGKAYVAHVIPEVVPVTLNSKERKYVTDKRPSLRDHDLSLWKRRKGIATLPK